MIIHKLTYWISCAVRGPLQKEKKNQEASALFQEASTFFGKQAHKQEGNSLGDLRLQAKGD